MKDETMTEFKMVPVEPTPEIITALYGPALDWPAQDARRRAWAEALAAAPPAPVVKGLEWVEVSFARSDEDPRREPSGDYEAGTPFGFYYIEQYFGTDSYGWKVTFDSLPVADKDDPDAAKASAQADYEARVRSALA
jgi:hypothetical protein